MPDCGSGWRSPSPPGRRVPAPADRITARSGGTHARRPDSQSPLTWIRSGMLWLDSGCSATVADCAAAGAVASDRSRARHASAAPSRAIPLRRTRGQHLREAALVIAIGPSRCAASWGGAAAAPGVAPPFVTAGACPAATGQSGAQTPADRGPPAWHSTTSASRQRPLAAQNDVSRRRRAGRAPSGQTDPELSAPRRAPPARTPRRSARTSAAGARGHRWPSSASAHRRRAGRRAA